MANILVSVKNISVKQQSENILTDTSIDIRAGEHVAIIGKSGSGKSVLLKVLAGLQRTTAGSADYYFINRANGNNSGSHIIHKVALVDSRHHFKNRSNTTDFYYQQRFNSLDADDSPTVTNYLAEIAGNKKYGYWTTEKVIDRLAIKDIYDKELIKLSNGETKRVRLASSLLKNPELLLLDQPLTGLDIEARKSFNLLLKEIADAGTTIIITASPNEIPDIADKVIWMDRGKVKSISNASDINPAEFDWQDAIIPINEKDIKLLIKNKETAAYHTFIKMTNVSVKYGDKIILKNINWEVKQGERWALLGHNGAGKSTLLSLLYGDNPQAYANNIVLFDKQRGTGESIWDIKKRCGFVSPELFQYFPADNSCIKVIESGFYDTLGLFRHSEPSRAALALKWMQVLGIEKYQHQNLKNIPVGIQRLCLLARALVKNPDLLILDEPCQGLDDEQKAIFKNTIETICGQSNLTLIYVTHYIEELPGAVEYCLKLEDGKVIK